MNNKEEAKDELIKVLYCQVMDLSMMSKIELGDDVTAEIKRLQDITTKKIPKKDFDEMVIARQIKTALENSNLNVVITPIMFDSNEFIPVLGVLVKCEDSSYSRKYTITVKPL